MAKVTEEVDLKLNDTNVDSELSKVANSAKKADESISHLQKGLNKLNQSAEQARVDDFSKKFEEAHNTSDELSKSLEELSTRLQSLGDNDIQGLRQIGAELSSLRTKTQNYSQSLKDMNISNTDGYNLIDSNKAMGQINSLAESAGSRLKNVLQSKVSQGFTKALNLLKRGLDKIWDITKNAISKYMGMLKSGFSNLFNVIKNKLTALPNMWKNAFGGLGGLFSQFKGLLGVIGFGALIKNIYELSNSAINLEGTMKNVFGEMTDDIRDWSDEFASRFTLTSMQARSFATEFGTALGNLGLDDKAKTEMSKNLTALSGDIASFYGKSAEESAKLVKGAVTGQTRSLKQLGIVLNDTTLNQYALAQGYAQTYTNMSETDKAITRYNYLLSQTVGLQGTATNSAGTWTDQIRMLKANFQQLGAILGGLLIKVLYPLVTVLNQIVVSAVNAMNALGKIMGFDPVSLSELTGAGAGAIDDTADALDNEADAIDGVGKASKKASENLQGFDKLNNMTTQNSSGAGSSKIGGAGGLGIDSYWGNIPDNNKGSKLLDFFNELWELLGAKDWKGAGAKIAEGINYIFNSIYDFLTGDKIYEWLDNAIEGIAEFFEGLLDIDFNKIGATLGAGINIITHIINTVYETFTDKNLIKQAGAKLADFFLGLADEIKPEDIGKALTTGLRTAMDFLRGFFDQAEATELSETLSEDIKGIINGAIDRLFGNGGAEEIGKNIASLLNFAFDLLSGLFDPENASKLGDSIVKALETAFDNIDEEKLKTFLSNLLNTIGNLFNKIADMDTSELTDKIANSVNGVAEDGSLQNAFGGLLGFIAKLPDTILELVKKIDWHNVLSELHKGLADAFTESESMQRVGGILASKLIVGLLAGLAVVNPKLAAFAGAAMMLVDMVTKAFHKAVDIFDDISYKVESQVPVFHVDFEADSLDDYIYKLKDVQNAYDNVDGSIEGAKKYLDELKAAGMENTEQFKRLDEAINTYDNSGLLQRQSALQDVMDACGEVQAHVNQTTKSLAELDEQQFTNLANSWNDLEVGTNIYTGKILTTLYSWWQNIKDWFSNIWSYIKDFFTNLWTDITTKFTDITNSTKEFFTNIWNNVKEAFTNIKNDVTSFFGNIGNNIKDFISEAKEYGLNIIDNVVELCGNIKDKFFELIDSAKDIGMNIINGIKDGILNNETLNNLWNGIGDFCSNMVNKFKEFLGIHSPSKVFESLAKFIPDGVALGIEDEEDEALDSIEKFSKDMVSKFNPESINIREMLNIDGIDEVMSSARDKISSSLQGLQSDVFVQPNFRRSELDAITAQGSTNAVLEQKLTNMASRMNMNNSNRQMTVSVYLDASNKLGDFIIDTVNGQVVRGGAF